MSSWTTQGTVSVTNNSKKVYGAGTPWVSNGKTRPGDEIIMPNGARHEVESVQSNTELTLVEPYMGATASGQTYALLHIGLLPAELAVKISDLQSKYLATIAQLYEWETSEAATVPITNPATGVTAQVKPLARFLAALGDGSMPGSFTTLTASGGVSSNVLILNSASSGYQQFRQGVAGTTYLYQGVGTSGEVVFNAPSVMGQYYWQVNGTTKMSLNSTGLSVTGALTTNGIKEGAAGNVGIGITPRAWFEGLGIDIGSYGGIQQWASQAGMGLHSNSYRSGNGVYTYKEAGCPAAMYLQGMGIHSWHSAPSGTADQPITFTQEMTLDANGNLLVGVTAASGKLDVKTSGSSVSIIAENADTADTTSTLFAGYAANAFRFFVYGNGNVQNQNNSYGAISDIKHKERITDTSPKLDKLLLVRIVDYFLKADPTHKLLGVIAQELELIFPGMIEETPDYEDVEVTPARIEQKITQRQKVEYREDVRYEILEVEGKWKRLPIRTSVEIPLFEEFPLFEQDGTAVMECVEAAQAEVVGEDGAIISPAKDAVWRQATHRVAVMEDVTETVDVPAVVERRATGEVTKSVKYSVFVPMLIKAMQEQQAIIDGLESRLTALEAA